MFHIGRHWIVVGATVLALLAGSAVAQSHPSAILAIAGTANGTSGSISIIVDGQMQTVLYGPFSSAESVAAGFGALFSSPAHSIAPPLCTGGFCAQADGARVVFQFADTSPTQAQSWSSTSGAPFSVDDSLWPRSNGQNSPVDISLLCSPEPVPVGSFISCTANVPAGTIGAVSFVIDGSSWQPAVTIAPNGNAVATGGLGGAAVGIHLVEADYTSANGIVSTAWQSVEVVAASAPSTLVYFYSILQQAGGQSGYLANGNIQAYTDSVNGSWSLGYDALSRLTSTSAGPVGGGFNTFGCWNYDSFGNRLVQAFGNQAPTQNGCTPSSGTSSYVATAMEFADNTNRITGRSTVNAAGQVTSVAALDYDAAGNIIQDHSTGYQFVYDGRGNLCAAHTSQGMIGYMYDAEGRRVAKGTINSMVCDPTQSGFAATVTYALGETGESMTEISGGAWSHTNVHVNGEQIATYDQNGIHFQIHDWLGTRRIQTNYAGMPEDACSNRPFGDNQQCSNPVSNISQEHFTGKERDTESGLDYFGARYYSGSIGRFMSPDPSGLAYADPANPQSLNLYSYALNNPLKFIDPSGLFCEYGADDYTPENGHLESTDYNSNTDECKKSGGMWSPDGYGQVNGDFTDAVYSLRGYFTQQIKSDQMNECQALASFVTTVQQMGNQDPTPAMAALTPNRPSLVKRTGVQTDRDGQAGFYAQGGNSGFLPQYKNDQDDEPGWNGDQSHHFAAFFQLGALRPNLGRPAPAIFERYQSPRSPNQGDIALGDEAEKLGRASAKSGGDVGAMIRSQVCQ